MNTKAGNGKEAGNQEKYIWNMLASLMNAVSSVVLSIAVNRILGISAAGIFAFAFANAQLFLVIGGLEVRPFQSTDVKEEYSFASYFHLRVLSSILMMLVTVVYITVNHFSFEKGMVILILCSYKMWESFADVYGGRFQQLDRIDIYGKTFFVRSLFSTISFIAAMCLGCSLIPACLVMLFISLFVFFVNDRRYIFPQDRGKKPWNCVEIRGLVMEILPLFLGTFLMNYISNAPKYAINGILGDESQNIYNILFMPAFTINMFSLFVFRPMLVTYARNWQEGRRRLLAGQILKMNLVILATTLLAELCAATIGIPVLQFIYGVNLVTYRKDLMLVMLGGGISALVVYDYYVITTMRKQNFILLGYGLGAITAFLLAERMVKELALRGAILSYIGGVLAIELLFAIGILVFLSHGKERKETYEE